MNKISIIVESILGAAVIALFVLFFTVNPWAKKPADGEVEAQGELLPIAVVNTDSILAHYTLAVEANDKLQSKYEESMVKMDGKAKVSVRRVSNVSCRTKSSSCWLSSRSWRTCVRS